MAIENEQSDADASSGPVIEPMNVPPRPTGFYALLDAIEQSPPMYIGSRSLHDLFLFLNGYSCAIYEMGIVPSDEEVEFQEFDEFVQKRYRMHDTGGWARKII